MSLISEKIYTSESELLSPLSPNETYSTIVKEAIKLLGSGYGSIILFSNDGFKRVYSSHPKYVKVKIRKRGNTYKAFKKRMVVISSSAEFGLLHPEFQEQGINQVVFIPLFNHEESLGVLVIYLKKEYKYTKDDLGALRLFGSIASLVIRKAQLYDDTKQALETRDIFISMVAHEFRTPITSISGYAQLLRTKIPNDDSTLSRWVDGLSSESLRLTLLINEMLEVNQIKTGKLVYNWKECEIRIIIGRALNNFQFTNPERTVVFTDKSVGSGLVIGDFDKLLQVFNNLLENSAKFSNPATEIFVTLENKDGFLVITINDQGVGIKQEEISKVFNNFFRGTNSKKEGMGVGLFLVKDIITRHKGKISVKSELNKGTTFQIKLPISRIK